MKNKKVELTKEQLINILRKYSQYRKTPMQIKSMDSIPAG
jgi:hypothetical protein